MLDLLFSLDLLPAYSPRSVAQVPELTGELHNAVIGFLALTVMLLIEKGRLHAWVTKLDDEGVIAGARFAVMGLVIEEMHHQLPLRLRYVALRRARIPSEIAHKPGWVELVGPVQQPQ